LKHICKYHIAGFLIAAFVCFAKTSEASVDFYRNHNTLSITPSALFIPQKIYVQAQDTTKLPFPLKPEDSFASDKKSRSSFNLDSPSNVIITVDYDPKTKQYTIYEKVGKYNIKPPRVMSEDEYRSYQFENSLREYWRQQSSGQSANAGNGLLPRMQVGGETFDRIFGSNTVEIIPQGNADLSFAINSSITNNPHLAVDMRKMTTFDFKSKIQMNVDGKVGDKLKMNVQYNTEATFDFENNVKVEYTGYEDEIIQKIEAGNVALPLPGTLITGSQSLFGFKTQLKFGRLNITTVFSKQNGQTQVIEVKGGAQTKEFSITADEYEANKNFFLSEYFRDTYNQTLKNLPIVNTGVNITKIEVWITNKNQSYENSRDGIAFIDIGESQANIYAPANFTQTGSGLYPRNELNDLYSKMTSTYQGIRDIKNASDVLGPIEGPTFTEGNGYERLQNARKLLSTEYTYNANLGYISLLSTLGNDEQLAVAYEYTVGGNIYKVGEFSTDGVTAPSALILKLLMGSSHTPQIPPTWKLMMKNIYSLGAYGVEKESFFLDVYYRNDITGTDLKYLPEGNIANVQLIKVLNLDNLNSQGDAKADGIFDFLDGSSNSFGAKVPITINSTNGKVIFPVLEPFGRDLASKIGNTEIAKRYVYQELYDSSITQARLVSSKNKFKIAGTYQSSSSNEISLNAANIPKGSVIVTAGGAKLIEGVDYTVDYNLGSVRITRPGLIESGMPIKISLENNALFNFQTKTLIGSHFDYQVSDKFNIGATILNLTERPLTQKVNFGNEAISNTIWGLNTSFQTESSVLTKIVDLLPFYQTKEKSTITFDAEFAQLIPGYSKAIGKNGTVFLDDFESSTSPVDLLSPLTWKLASTPMGQPSLFSEANLNDRRNGFNRALVAWYYIDPLFLGQGSNNPSYIRNSDKMRSSHWVREIYEHELFPYKNTPQGQPTNLLVMNVAFYPNERGPYNYNEIEIDNNGFLTNPEKRWGGIMRPIGVTDFEALNINYIEFWLMDPFVYDTLTDRGGDLYFDLGSLSEDVLRDKNISFEGGLPITSALENTLTTDWGRVPENQSIPNAFTTNTARQKYQDVGLDGLSSNYDLDGDGINDEDAFFAEYLNHLSGIVNTDAYDKLSEDPSNDNYRYFLDPYYTTVEAGILDRYKKYNNTEGNSPENNNLNSGVSTQLPDNENIDPNPALSRTESYFQYKVSLRHSDMRVGKNFITNKLDYYAKLPAYSEKQKVSWYQFKIPIDKYVEEIGTPGFNNISLIRMFLKGFSDTLMLRFAKLQMVRDEWRKYDAPMIEGQEGVPGTDLSIGNVSISAVNLEDNSSRTPINYILPPGLQRTTDPSQSQTVEQNEQSMEIKIVDLADGDARAAYKSLNVDIRKYRKLKMDVHAEAIPGFPLYDNDVTLFLRLGSDNTNNYYEYEVPLKITPIPPKGRYNNNSDADREIVWPRENLFDINLELLTNAKLARNDAMHKDGSSINFNTVYVKMDGDRKIKIRGNPSLSNVKVIMIGVRNPGRASDPTSDGQSKSVIVWVNELRVSNTTNESGWAANGQLSAKLADLGMLTIAGSTYKPGFGSIESKVSDRKSEDYYQYDVNTTLELGKFFPEKVGVKLPLYLGYRESFSNPEYNPLDPDIPLRTALKNASSDERDSIKRVAQDYTRTKSLNFTNVKIDRVGAKPWPLALSNFSVSYYYREDYARNIKTDHRINREIRGALTYNYNTNSKPIVPLKKVDFLNSKYLRLIKDFNFNPIPSQFSFRTELTRTYFEQQLRNISNPDVIFQPTYSKDFSWNRIYTLNWDIAQSLKFDFNATNIARIDEPDGIVDRRYRNEYQHWRDSVWHNILNFGRTTQYNHQFNLAYTLPLNKIPLIDWTSASARYTGNYSWVTGPVLSDTSTFDPGNTIQNSNTIQLMGQLNLLGLYNKFGYLKRINQKFDQMAQGVHPKQKMNTVKYEEKGIKMKANIPRSIFHKLGTEIITVKLLTEKGTEIKVKPDIKSDERIVIKTDKDYENLRVVVEGKVPEKTSPFQVIAETSIRVLMGFKSIQITLTENRGSLLPGYKPTTKFFGTNDYNGVSAPGFAFITGWQDPEFAWKAINNGWLTKDTTFSKSFDLTSNENITYRTTFEPFPSFRVELNALRTYSRNHSEYYSADRYGNFYANNPLITGNYSISIISAGTLFKSPNKVFERFRKSRITVANRMAKNRENRTTNGYERGNGEFPVGYSDVSQNVLIPSFLSAYSSYSPDNVPLTNFPTIPMPNWQVTYDGLAKMAPFKNFLRTFSLTHGYRSIYTIGAYTTNMKYDELGDGYSYVVNSINDFIPKREISNVSINEQFSPLIGLDMNWINNLTTRFELKTGRSLAMSFSNNQLTETDSWEYIIGGGYRFENLPLIFGPQDGKQRTLKSDLRLRVDFSLRKSQTYLHKMVEGVDIATSGQIATSIKTSADYLISNQVTLQAFFDWTKNTPLVSSTSFPMVNISFGFSLRFMLIP
jgi:cell surface protein SprA